MARAYEFPICCGIRVLGGLNWDTENFQDLYPNSKLDLELIRVRVKDFLKGYKGSVGLGLIALNSVQEKHGMGKILLEEGFTKLIGPVLHPGHGRYITLYGYEMTPPKKKEDEAPRKGIFSDDASKP